MSIFAKRHYEATAKVLRCLCPGALEANNRAMMQWRDTIQEFTDMFARDNSRFDRSRFEAACKNPRLEKAK
jgi:hypothetical protein